MTSRQAQIQEDTVFRLLRILQAQPDISQRTLAQQLGMSLGGLNYCLRGLMDKGLVLQVNLGEGRHLRKQGYILTPAGLAHRIALTSRFLQRKQTEYEALKAEIDALNLEVSSAGFDQMPAAQTGHERNHD